MPICRRSSVRAAYEEGSRTSQEAHEAAVSVARDALSEAVGAAQARGACGEHEAANAEHARREMHAELVRWRSEAEARGAALEEQRRMNTELSEKSEERVKALKEQLEQHGSLIAHVKDEVQECRERERALAMAEADAALRKL